MFAQHHTAAWMITYPTAFMPTQERVALARYAHLPLGNIGPDWELAAADALYARCLRDAKHVLWAADPSLPGLALHGCDSGSLLEEAPEEDECPNMEVRVVFLMVLSR